MPATMEQTRIDQLPTVTFDQEESTINATVIISPGDEPGTYRHHVSALSAAGPTGSLWNVIWTLAPTTGLSATFKNDGLIIPKPGTPLPAGVYNININRLDLSASQRQLTFTNNVTDVNVVRYDLDLDVRDSEGKTLARFANIIFDPTIAVVKEPMDG